MAIDILYNGKGLSPVLKNDGGQAMGRLSDAIIKAEQIKYNTFKENEKEFLKTSNIDPAFFISTANQQAQGKLLEDYNKKWSQRMKASGNNMPLEDKQQMIAEKNLIIAQQQKMQSDQDLWQQHRTMVAQNPIKFDADEFAVADAEYRKTGEYKLIRPPVKARSLDMALEDNAVTGNEINETIPEERDNLSGFTDVRYSATPEQAKERVKQLILGDEAYAKDAIKQFQSLPIEEKLPYLTDTNKDGKIDERDKSDKNAIIKWAQETKWEKARKKDVLAWRKTEASAPSGGFNLKVSVGSGNNKNQTFDVQENVNAYGTQFGKLLNLGRVSFTSDTQTIDKYTDLKTGKEIPVNDGTRFDVVSYSPDKDLIIAKVIDDTENGKLWQGQIIGLSGEKYNDLLKSKPFYIDRPSLLKQYGTTQTKPSVNIGL
jgi:hypothetical protein